MVSSFFLLGLKSILIVGVTLCNTSAVMQLAVQCNLMALSLVTLCSLRVSDLCPDCHSGGKLGDQSPQVVTSVPSLTTGTSINIPVFAGAGKTFHYAYFCSDPEPLKIA